jgi:hypothetical protein
VARCVDQQQAVVGMSEGMQDQHRKVREFAQSVPDTNAILIKGHNPWNETQLRGVLQNRSPVLGVCASGRSTCCFDRLSESSQLHFVCC